MEFDSAVAELDTLVATLERDGDERALMLLQLMDAVHRPAIELIAAGEFDHPIAQAVLSMYDLTATDEHLEVEEALDEIRPYIESHGGGLDLLDIDTESGVVHVRMHGSCHGCAASAITLRRGVEDKLRERVPWFREVVSHEPEETEEADAPQSGIGARLVQIEHYNPELSPEGGRSAPSNGGQGGQSVPSNGGKGGGSLPSSGGQGGQSVPSSGGQGDLLQIQGLKRPVFVEAGKLSDLPPGTMKAVDVDGSSILLINVDGEPYAFRNVCAMDGRSELHGGRLTGGTVLVCPWHNCPYDARSGKRLDDEPGAPSLAVVPVALRDGMLQVAANVA